MFGLFGALSNDSHTRIRFNGTILLGLLAVLGVSLGGLLGIGAALLLLSLCSFLTGWGIVSNSAVP
ncbi:hypothetical protein QMK33_14355 [Hymenobacter sp. H14-R3]|uniref:hypothetical protein n=1 Tax=Hymenobacter sp. H14-R3 TaxID=3046308 RepID=UPI0024B99C09|nr:hypothetical protein [Hymenobacter sp. H14-R3]MDJ0366338.1 hypothetical protein [Hymenobacter sp. H14-R3]